MARVVSMQDGRERRRIVCVGDFVLGSRRAHAINVLKTSGGFARLGWDVLLLCREPEGTAREGTQGGRQERSEAIARRAAQVLASFGEPGLRVEMLPEPGEKHFPHGTDRRCVPFAEWAVERGRAFGAEVMYARHADAAVLWAVGGGVAVAETHAHVGDSTPGFARLMNATRGERPVAAVSTISWRLKDEFARRGANPERVHVVPDGVDVELFARPGARGPGKDRLLDGGRPHASRPAVKTGTAAGPGAGSSNHAVDAGRYSALPGPLPVAQSRNGARGAAPLAVYGGHLYDWKGIPAVLEAAALLPWVRFELIGGMEEDIARVRRRVVERGLANVEVVGWVEHAALPERLWRADVLLLPPGLGDPSKDWTSPVKLGEYLAAGAPIVASGIPALRDWVDEPVVTWFEPDEAGSLARAVERALEEGAEAAARRRGLAMELARTWSYPERARRMLEVAGVVADTRGPVTLIAAGSCPVGSERAAS